MTKMRYALIALAAALAACQTTKRDGGKAEAIVKTDMATEAPELEGDDATRIVRRTERNVDYYQELRLQGQTQQMVALHRTIGRTVDTEFPVFKKMAFDREYKTIQRNMAVKCLGFAIEKREEARETLLALLEENDLTIVSNAALGLGVLRDPETDMTRLIRLLGHGNLDLRVNVASAVKELWRVKETPRRLTPQHWAAIDRLVTLMGDQGSTRGRRAAVWALANLHHPDVLEHLVSALQDKDEMVQIGGLYGIERLGDQRALEPLFLFLEDGPTSNAESWAKNALVSIAIKGGFANTPAQLQDLGTSPKLWRKWFKTQRMK